MKSGGFGGYDRNSWLVNSLCPACLWSRQVRSPTGSEFLLCRRHFEDDSYAKYPTQPVLECEGWQPEATMAEKIS